MKLKQGLIGAATAASLLAGTLVVVPAAAAPVPESFAPLVAQVKDAVVNIATTEPPRKATGPDLPQFPPGSPLEQFFRQYQGQNGPQKPKHALGSGFIIDPSGIVVTNNHVVDGASNIKVTLAAGATYDAKVLGRDTKTDLAVLKISADKPLPAVSFGRSADVQVGDWVLAVGNPFGLGGTVTAGILSARSRDIGAGPYDDFLQVDASINPGNSGGPTFNTKGQVIGINTAILSPGGQGNIGIGFAIPSDLAAPLVKQLADGGRIERGWIGVSVQPVTPDLARALKLPDPRGALVAQVNPDGPAAKAGLKAGDVIVAVGGKTVADIHDLPRVVADLKPGAAAEMTLLRDGSERRMQVAIAAQPDDPVQTAEAAVPRQAALGLSLAPVTDEVRRQLDLPRNAKGAVVVEVAPGSPAAEAALAEGDLIVRVNDSAVSSPADVAKAVQAVRREHRKDLALLVRRGGEERFVALTLA